MEKRKEMVCHPSHYTSHPSGVECIEVIRHYVCDIANAMKYLWRAGLKSENGMADRDKEVEDCRKAVWYLNDYLSGGTRGTFLVAPLPMHPSGVDCETVASCYGREIAQAFRELWWAGIIIGGCMVRQKGEEARVRKAIECIERHIKNTTDNTCEISI